MPPHLPPYPSGGNGPPNAPGSRTHRPPIAHPWLHALWPTIAQTATARHISAPTQTSTWHIPLASSCGYLCEAPARDARHGGLGHRLPHLSIVKALSTLGHFLVSISKEPRFAPLSFGSSDFTKSEKPRDFQQFRRKTLREGSEKPGS